MLAHQKLLEAIKARKTKETEFSRGILTADRFVQTVQDCVGTDTCYRFAAKGNVSFSDVMTKAANTLTYSNEDMLLEEQYDFTKGWDKKDTSDLELELPKNTLVVFKHVLTTPKKDRDGDILRTAGAKPDPRMLLLWNHVHTLPIGKVVGVAEHTAKKLSLYTAIVDINELSHDAAVMIENKMGRFSHGFRALDFSDMKADPGKTSGSGGFDVKVFEIMEASLVTVPSNTDAETEEIIVSLVSGKKLKSPLMVKMGKAIQEKRPLTTNVPTKGLTLDINLNVGGVKTTESDNKDAELSGTKCPCQEGKDKPKGGEAGKCGCNGGAGASKEADAGTDGEKDKSLDKEMICKKCGAKMKDGVCEKCGMKDAKPEEKELTAKDAMAVFLAKATRDERIKMRKACRTLNEIDERDEQTKSFKKMRSF